MLEQLQDLELILSHYHTQGYSQSAGMGVHRQELMFLRVALAAFLDDARNALTAAERDCSTERLSQFFRRRGYGHEDIFVVTTNYDLVLESALERIFGEECWCYPGFAEHSDCGDRIPVFKLHGSINWMEDRGPTTTVEARRPGPRRILKPSFLSLSAVQRRTSGYYFESQGQKYTPILVPPLYQKEYWFRNDNDCWRGIFRRTWDQAFKGLRSSSSRLFWGYSLPAADLDMFSNFMEVLVPSARNAHVEIVDKCPDTRMIRFGRYLNPPAKIHADGLESFLNSS